MAMPPRNPVILLSEDKEFCAALARKLEIQADGGDDPAEFVSFALAETQREKMIAYHQRKISEISEPPK